MDDIEMRVANAAMLAALRLCAALVREGLLKPTDLDDLDEDIRSIIDAGSATRAGGTYATTIQPRLAAMRAEIVRHRNSPPK